MITVVMNINSSDNKPFIIETLKTNVIIKGTVIIEKNTPSLLGIIKLVNIQQTNIHKKYIRSS